MNFNAELSRLYFLAQTAEKNNAAFQSKAWKIYLAIQQEKRKLAKREIQWGKPRRKRSR